MLNNLTSECATIIAGVLTAASTIGAVVYTNNRTKEQLVKQEEKFSKERIEENRQNKFITIQHKTLLNRFNDLLNRLIIENDYSRTILFSGKDGFEFYDDFDKRATQQCRIFIVDNPGVFELKDVEITTSTLLKNLDSDKEWEYNTVNIANIFRPKESIVLRLANEEQWKQIVGFNKTNCTNELVFKVSIKYTTEALQRLTYEYTLKILNDKKFEVLQDAITNVENIEANLNLSPSIFRNLQDSISHIDRASYIWERQGEAQMKGLMSQYNFNNPQQNKTDNTPTEIKENENG